MSVKPGRNEGASGFRTTADDRRFASAYDAALARWPQGYRSEDVASTYGTTRVYLHGPADAPPLVLLHGGGATAMVWYRNVADLARHRRVVAPDQPGQAGRSLADGAPLESPDHLVAWLDEVLDGLALDRVGICGHSYGAWLALTYAVRHPARVTDLTLLDPTDCFARTGAGYRVRAVPLFVRPSPPRARAFVAWETGGRPLDELSLAVFAAGAAYQGTRVVLPRRPEQHQLLRLRAPTLVVAAGRSRPNRGEALLARARAALPDCRTASLPEASHFSIPATDADHLNALLAPFHA